MEGDEVDALYRSALHVAEHFGEAPALLVACTESPARRPASVFPAVQNLMLAARALDLGTTLTTATSKMKRRSRRFSGSRTASTLTASSQSGSTWPLGEAKRKPVEEIAYRDVWGDPFVASTSAE